MACKIFMTGFPGFIAQRLVDRLLDRDPEATFTMLIEDRMRGVADATIKGMERDHPGFIESTTVLTGDICKQRLGLLKEVYDPLAAETTHVWHLAAVYDLAVSQTLAHQVNVMGTANLLDFCDACSNLARLDYVSTCYVSGDRRGVVLESELLKDQGFKNHYESSKCWAEVEVRRRMYRLPVTIHRPAIVVGDSRTGETDKYDGPYFLIALFSRLPAWVPMVHFGGGAALMNLVPVDFLVDAMAEIWTQEKALAKTVHLADPYPHSAREVMESISRALGVLKPVAAIPPGMAEGVLGVGLLRKLIKIPRQSVVYLNHEVTFDTANQRRLLAGTGISCPDLMTYLPAMVEFVKGHPDRPFLDGRTP